MDGFEQHRAEFETLGARVVAASVDDLEKTQEVADGKGFPFGWGVTRDMADAIGAWWEDRRGIIQPSEFILDADGKVVCSSYSDGPLGRIDAADAVKLIGFYESRKG